MTPAIGRRYLCGMPPFGLVTVVYLGLVPGWPRLCRVRMFLTGRVVWVKTVALRPLLVDLNAKGRSE